MHGLINRALQTFACHTFGLSRWQRATDTAGLGFSEFEAMLIYDDDQTWRVLEALCDDLGRSRDEMLEDLGTFLVSHPALEALRRLLRFSGVTYVDFLHSLDDLPDRTRLAVADLHLPQLELREHACDRFSLTCGSGLPGFSAVMTGVLRAMADDYGALVMLETTRAQRRCDVISVTLIEQAFAKGRSFDLGARAG